MTKRVARRRASDEAIVVGSGPNGLAAAITLADWRFERAAGNSKGRALITNVVFVFARDAGTDLAALRRECLVGDLRDFIYLKTDAGYRRGT